MKRAYRSFLGIDLGGGRGKTTAVAELRLAGTETEPRVAVFEVAVRSGQRPWTDDTLLERLAEPAPGRVIAVNAPLTAPACGRCTLPACVGIDACAEPAVAWLRTTGRALVQGAVAESVGGRPRVSLPVAQARLAPYAHRVTDVAMTYQRGLAPPSALGATHGAVAARAGHLRKRLRSAGYELHENLIEVSPPATVAALFGPKQARGYKRDADPWRTRALILERLADLSFAPQSRMAREEVLRNDHCFDAVLAAYTAWLWARDGWAPPPAELADDGWIYAP